MPVFNCAQFVVDAARSVLEQDHTQIELLIVDDGSTDGTLDRLKSAIDDERMVVIDGRVNLGLPSRLNELIGNASGEFVARMDGDDICYPTRFSTQLRFLLDNKSIDLVACSMTVIDNQNRLIGKNEFRGADHSGLTARPWRGFHLNHATWLARRSFFERFRYNERARFVEDDELLLRAYQTATFAMLPDRLYAYRIDGLKLSRILQTRFNFTRMVLRGFFRDRKPSYLLAVPDQFAKALIDSVVIGSGLERRLLHHRFGTIEDDDVRHWAPVRDQLRILDEMSK